MSDQYPVTHCAGCGGPSVPEGEGCAGCARRRRRWEEAEGVDLETVQGWTDDEDGDDLAPNKRARAIGNRPAMDTSFGDEIEDPEAIPAKAGRHLDKAMDRYETFHAKKPLRLIELEHELPESWGHMGDALSVMYRTDKWKADGTDEDYKHLHDAGDDKPYLVNKGVKFYEPKRGGQRLPVARPHAIALLGYCLGAFVRQGDGEIYETNPRGCYLFSSPLGDLLLIYSPDKQPDGSSGFLAAMSGGKLCVLKDGIDG